MPDAYDSNYLKTVSCGSNSYNDPTLPRTYCYVTGSVHVDNKNYNYDCALFTPPTTNEVNIRCESQCVV